MDFKQIAPLERCKISSIKVGIKKKQLFTKKNKTARYERFDAKVSIRIDKHTLITNRSITYRHSYKEDYFIKLERSRDYFGLENALERGKFLTFVKR